MKIYKLIYLLLAITIMSCYDDLGSYDYVEINEIEIEGLEDRVVLYKIDTLRISPKLNISQDVDDSNFEYEWVAVLNDYDYDNPTKIKLGTELDLIYPVDLLPETYTLYLKVYDKSTQVRWMNGCNLKVSSSHATGFLLLGENEEGYVELDMITMVLDTAVMKSILKDSGIPKLKGPQRVMHTGTGISSFDHYVRLWIMSDDGSYYLNSTTLKGTQENQLQQMVYTSYDLPSVLNPTFMISKNRTGKMETSRVMQVGEEAIFRVSMYTGEYYDNPINRYDSHSGPLFRMFPYVFSPVGYPSGFVIYDKDNERFVKYSSFSSAASLLNDGPGDVFPWQQEGRTIVFGENTMNIDGGNNNGNSFAIMKDEQEKYFIYKFKGGAYPSKNDAYDIIDEVGTLLPQAKNITFSSTRTLLLFTIDNVLYGYDYNPSANRLYQQTFKDEITCLHFDLETNSYYRDLFVATYNDEKKGILQKYIVGEDHNTFTLEPDENCYWENLVKIKDIEWRNSSK